MFLSNVSSCGALRCYQVLSLESPGMTAYTTILLVGTLVCQEDDIVFGATGARRVVKECSFL